MTLPPMTPERWHQVTAIFHAALEKGAADRSAYVEQACGDDRALRAHVDAMLSADGSGDRRGVALLDLLGASEDLPPGTRIGPYRVEARIGSGGMGTVYRAHDTTLARDVALKVLPAARLAPPDQRVRFEREARLLASLNHPNIAAIYGLTEGFPQPAIVMELVSGPTLADLIDDHGLEAGGIRRPVTKGGSSRRKALALKEVVRIAKQIAAGLDVAHERGIVHRDLKPANVKLGADGTVKILDFGIAKLSGAGTPDPAAEPAPGATAAGFVLGTPAYMSPEQARGLAVDKRTDIWAFGCVLFALLAGRAAFSGATVADVLANVIDGEPDWSALPASTPPGLRTLLRRCLEKDSAKRLRDMGDVQFELADDGEVAAPAPPATTVQPRSPWRERAAWLAAAVAAAAGLGAGIWWPRTRPPAVETRFEVSAPTTLNLASSFALSPDGRSLVFSAEENGRPILWLRPLDTPTARQLAGTDGGTNPFWSPGSDAVGFIADGKLKSKRLELDGGVQEWGPGNGNAGASWGASGILLGTATGLYRIPLSGGDRVLVVKVDGATRHAQPQFLPDGKRFVFYCGGPHNVRGVYLGSLDDPTVTRLTDADAAARYVEPGWLLYVSRGSLVARRLDLERRVLSGDPTPIADDLSFPTYSHVNRSAAYSVAADGTIAYRSGSLLRNQLTWFDRNGAKLGTLGDSGPFWTPRLSSDGTRAAVVKTGSQTDVWIVDAIGASRFTFSETGTYCIFPVWSEDDSQLAYTKVDGGRPQGQVFQAMLKPSAGGGTEAALATIGPNMTDWSRDGRYILVDKSPVDLWVIPADGKSPPFPFIDKTEFRERLASFSPNQRWVLYQSDHESGPAEIYIRPFPPGPGQWKVSHGGGAQPRWNHEGTEVYWIAPDATLMMATVRDKGTSVVLGAPRLLFQTQIYMGGNEQPDGGQYDVAPDGRFLINTVVQPASTAITVLQHWRGFGR